MRLLMIKATVFQIAVLAMMWLSTAAEARVTPP
jgi:hypothetical protein